MNKETPDRSTKEERKGLTAAVEASGVTPRLSGATRSMQQPTEMQRRSSGTGASQGGRRSEETEERKIKGASALFIRVKR